MSIVELISMKNRFTKIILIILVISIIPMLSGFCIFRLSSINLIKIDVAQAAGVDHNINNILNDVNPCGGGQPTDQDSRPALPISTNHNQSSFLPCCIDSGHNGLASIIQSVESGLSTPVALFPQNQPKISSPQIVFIYNSIISPPKLALIKTTVLRL